MAKKQCSIVLDNELIEYLTKNTAGNSLSAKIDTALREYKSLKETTNSTGIEKDLLTLTDITKRITEYVNKGNNKPIPETKQVTTKVEEKKEVKKKDIFDDDEFDFDYKDEELE